MNDHDHPDDERLLEELGRALAEADTVPDDVLAAAKASFTWRTVDAELAALAFDSAVDELVGVRGEGGERQLTFATEAVEIEVSVIEDGTQRRIVGQLVPPQAATVELLAGGDIRATETDDTGTFAYADVPSGPVSFRCTLADGTAVTTEVTIL